MTPAKPQLRAAVERLFAKAKKLGLRRVKDPEHLVEYDGLKLCRVCAIELAYMSDAPDLRDTLSTAVVVELGRRADDPKQLRTVPDMRAMRKLFDDAVENMP